MTKVRKPLLYSAVVLSAVASWLLAAGRGASSGEEQAFQSDEPRSGVFQSDGLNLHYVEWGATESPPMILLHHINSHARTWDRFARSMRDDFRVIALDLRGHGDSDWAEAGGYTTEDYAADVAALVRHLDLQPAVVLGGSTGGRVGLVYAAQNPDQVLALIMEDVGAVRPQRIADNFAERLTRGDPEFDTEAEWAEELRRSNRRADPEVFSRLAMHGTRRLPSGKLGLKRDPALLAELRPIELWDAVRELRAPLLLILGAESTIVGPDQTEMFRSIRPDVEIVTIPDAGHIVVHDQPERFEEAVRGFLGRRGLDGR